MTGLVLFALLRLWRGTLLGAAHSLFARRGKAGSDLLFALSYSTRQSVHEMMLLGWMLRLLDGAGAALLALGVSGFLGLPPVYAAGGVCLGIFAALIRLVSRMQRNQLKLIREMSSFVFRYEMALLGGQHQYLALREASRTLALFEAQADVDGYIEELGNLFSASKWMAIKKVIILLERGKHFSGESLSMEFAQVSSELFERYSRSRRLQLEKRENLILLPMSANMLIMMIYVAVPFLSEYLWR